LAPNPPISLSRLDDSYTALVLSATTQSCSKKLMALSTLPKVLQTSVREQGRVSAAIRDAGGLDYDSAE